MLIAYEVKLNLYVSGLHKLPLKEDYKKMKKNLNNRLLPFNDNALSRSRNDGAGILLPLWMEKRFAIIQRNKQMTDINVSPGAQETLVYCFLK